MPTLIRTRPTLEVSVDFAANPTASYADIHETDDGAVLFWRLNSTSTLLDEFGVNNGTQISTPTTIAGPYPYDTDLGTTFDGANDSAYVLNSTSLSTQSGFSVDGWVRVASLPGSTVDLVTKRGSWLFQMNTSGQILWTLKDDTSTITVTSNSVVATNTWYHVVGVYDDTTALLYFNGVLDNSSAYSSGMEFSPRPIRFAASESITAPTWQSSTSTAPASAALSVVVTVPASVASGDLLVAHIGARSSSLDARITPPAGWTLLTSEEASTQLDSHIYYRVSPGGEPANYTWTSDLSVAWQAGMSRITGQDALVPFANPGYSLTSAAATTHSTCAHVPNCNNVLALAFFHSPGVTSWTQSSGTERYDITQVGGAGISMCSQVVTSGTSLTVVGTSVGSAVGTAHMVFVNGTGLTETACSLDDFTYWSRALDSDDVARNYNSKDSGTPSWTNVTLEVREAEMSLPERRHELDILAAGKMGMTLREVDDKDFDPGNTSSPYGPDVEQRVRVRATWNSTTYDVFRGYADRWTPTRLGGADVEEVQFEATDGFDLLALAPVEGSMSTGFSGAHIDAILSKALWPVADRDLDAGQYVMNGYSISEGTFALSLLQEIAGSERGICFIDAAGVFHFHDAAHRGSQSRSTTSQATFCDYISNIATSTDIRYQFIQPTRDKDKIINIWTVSPDSGVFGAVDQTVRDHISIAKYGPRAQSRSTRLATNTDANDQAGNLLTDTAYPADRYESMKVIPLTTESYATCLDLRISDRVTVKRGFNPGWDGATMTRDYFVEGKTVHIADKTAAWEFTFVLSPVSSGNYYATIMRDGPVSYWRMDTLT